MAIGQLDTKRGIGEDFGDLSFELNRFFFRHGGVGGWKKVAD
jgi:hypothetical protein